MTIKVRVRMIPKRTQLTKDGWTDVFTGENMRPGEVIEVVPNHCPGWYRDVPKSGSSSYHYHDSWLDFDFDYTPIAVPDNYSKAARLWKGLLQKYLISTIGGRSDHGPIIDEIEAALNESAQEALALSGMRESL
jgi:hypothetical protein